MKNKLNKSARHDALRTAHGNTEKDRWYGPICDEDQKDDMIKVSAVERGYIRRAQEALRLNINATCAPD